jgi:molybdopterin-guanine dinucleotide biosynthesis protein A
VTAANAPVTADNAPRKGVSAIVLAGGRASRFGADKLAAELEGESLLKHAISAVRTIADEVIVVGRSNPDPQAAIRSIPDAEPFAGPLAALGGALEVARGRSAIVVGGDMPRLVPAVLELLLARLEADQSIEAVILAAPGIDDVGTEQHPQVLPLALGVSEARNAVRAALAAGDWSLVRLIARLTSAEIPAAEWLRLDPGAETLLDVDSAEDLARIRSGDLR